MTKNEKQRVNEASTWYLGEQVGFDIRLIQFRYETLRPYLQGPHGLEIGPAEGNMTRLLIANFEQLTVVDGAKNLLDAIPSANNLIKIHALFEEFCPTQRFDTIIMEHILEHVENPVDLLRRGKEWLAPGGRLLAGVPNGNSFHRLAAVKMGLLKHHCELNARDLKQGHRRVYTRETFDADIRRAGLTIKHAGGVFFKPLSNQQIDQQFNEMMLRGFYELGKDFPSNAADLYVVCTA